MLLAVLVALGSASLFTQNGSSATTVPTISLTPTAGCPGTIVALVATFPFPDQNGAVGVLGVVTPSVIITSDPDGLISKATLDVMPNSGIEVRGTFTVGDLPCVGPHRVTLTLVPATRVAAQAETLLSVSALFTVGGEGCPNLRGCRPVGGVVMPANTLAITAPYLALAGIIIAISAVIVVKRRRD